MKFLFAILIFFISTKSLAFEVTGSFACKITNQTLWHVVDGKSKEFGGYSGRPKIGDYIQLSYEYSDKFDSLEISSDIALTFLVRIYLETAKSQGDDRWIDLTSKSGQDSLGFGENAIVASSFTKRFTLRRYYKNDWYGLLTDYYSDREGIKQQMTALDCRHESDQIQKILTHFNVTP